MGEWLSGSPWTVWAGKIFQLSSSTIRLHHNTHHTEHLFSR